MDRKTTHVVLSDLDDDVESCDVLSILVKEGDVVDQGQDLVEIETGKATLSISSSEAGRIAKIHIAAGDTISVGAVLLEIEAIEEADATDQCQFGQVDGCVNNAEATSRTNGRSTAPSNEPPIDEQEVAVLGTSESQGNLRTDKHGNFRVERMSRLRQTIARNMVLSYTTIPQLTNFDEVDVTELERVRSRFKNDYASQGIKLTVIPFLVKALVDSLKKFPVINATINMERNEILLKEYVNVGIAVDTERGLIVPVLRGADRKGIAQIALELNQRVSAARSGSINLEDLRGGTFTISNLGSVGGLHATPIINPPEVAIMMVGSIRSLPRVVNGEIVPRLVMPLSLSYDHRVVDGAMAARFLNRVKEYLTVSDQLLSSM